MQGSIQKRVGKTGKVTWTCVVDGPPDPVTGKRKQRRLSAPTKRELQDEVTKLLHAAKSGAYVAPTGQTMRDYFTTWLQAHKATIRETTARSYEQLIRVHILPALGNVPLQNLTAGHLDAFYADKLAAGLSPRTVQYRHSVIRKALQRAWELDLVNRNVTDKAAPPRQSRPQIETWDTDQLRRFLRAAEGDGYGPAWLVLATTGLRRGELLGLRWQDVDLETGRLHVRRSLVEVGASLRIQEPKTAAGRRVVPLAPTALVALKAYRTGQLERRLKLGPGWKGNDPAFGELVLTARNGAPIRPSNFLRRFKALAASAGLPDIALHGLRHAHATQLLGAGVPIKVVSERLGHSKIALTMDAYCHVLPGMQEAATAATEAALFGAA